MEEIKEWAKNLEASISTREEAQARESAEFVARQEFLRAHAPRLWDELLQAFRNCCAAITKYKLVASQQGPDTLIVRRDGGVEALTVDRNPHNQEVSVSLGTTYQPSVNPRGDGKVAYACCGDYYSCEGIAEMAIESFVRSLS